MPDASDRWSYLTPQLKKVKIKIRIADVKAAIKRILKR